jgi:hypothetical protein
LALDLSTVADWNRALYACAMVGVDEFGGVDPWAADLEVSRQLLNLRLCNTRDSKGDVQKLRFDDFAHILNDPRARWAWLAEINRVCGAKPPEPVVSMTAEDKLRIVAGALSDRAKRQLEREHGMPSGSLS